MTARDIYPNELLRLASELLGPPGRGRYGFARAVSTTYYALFHRLSRDIAWAVLGSYGNSAAHDLVRWISHQDLLDLARQVIAPSPKFQPVLSSTSPDLRALREAFVRLQGARNAADTTTPTPSPERRFAAWRARRGEPSPLPQS